MPPLGLLNHPADEELVRRILEETGVAREAAGPPPAAYFGALVEAVIRWIMKLFADRPGLAGGVLDAAVVIAILTVALALVLVGFSVARRLRDRQPRGPAVPRLAWTEGPDEGSGSARRGRDAWRAEIETRLSRGDAAGALEALWWWLASSLPLETEADATWTTRELLVRARRRELLGLGAGLDVLMYGPRRPAPEDVSACLARFEAKLA